MKTVVRLDQADLRAGIAALRGKFPAAVRRALKRAGTSGRAEMAQLISADTGLSSGAVKNAVKLEISGDAAVSIVATGGRIPLIQFKARGPEPSRGRGRGVSYSLPGGRALIGNAFIATMPSGHRGVFVRRSGTGRLPIIEQFGPSLVRVFEKFRPQGQERALESLGKNLRSEISFAMSRR